MSDKFNAITKNRAEELGYDVWNDFVLPPYFDRLDITEARKPRIFIGGRGCGKTMLIRYLSHVSMFSKNRKRITQEDTENIGLYWRIDTHFASMMEKRGLEDDIWSGAFTHFSTLQISLEILRSLQSIADSTFENLSKEDLESLSFQELLDFDTSFPQGFDMLVKDLKSRQRRFHLWLNNVRTQPILTFLPKELIYSLIEIIKEQIPVLNKTIFFIYLDEYENLLDSQKHLVNTWLKHSEIPLIFNLAMKRNSFSDRDSVGIEQISKIHDFRVHDLELLIDEKSFSVFASEILFLRLGKQNYPSLLTSEVDFQSENDLNKRGESSYQNQILSKVRDIFPTYSQLELANIVINNKLLKKRLIDIIALNLQYRHSELSPLDFISNEYPQYSILVPALLNRQKLSPEFIHGELVKATIGQSSDFSSGKMWYHNMFHGCYIMFFAPLNRICPIYSGFDTYIRMARGNLRHFLELCHKSFSLSENSNEYLVIDQDTQNEAAKQAATSLLGEVKSFGISGNNLYTFIVRLGYVMYLSHLKPAQSEPEMTHFGIIPGTKTLSRENEEFLKEAVKWSVLFEVQSTKNKDNIETENFDYILNPVYSSYFAISHRKGRKLNLSTDQIDILINGDVRTYQALYKQLQSQWMVKISRQNNPTFSQLNFDLE